MNNKKRMFQHLRKLSEHRATFLLLLLLGVDTVFIVLNIIIAIFFCMCNIAGIFTYMNFYNLTKLFWIIVLFAYVLKTTGCPSYVSWILVFTFLLFDDALFLHQSVGDRLHSIFGTSLPHNLSLLPRYFELAVLALAGIFLLVIVAWAYSHSQYVFRKISKDILLFIVALVFLGLLVDLAVAIELKPTAVLALGLVEDSGEIVTISLILWYVFMLAIRHGKPEAFLHELLYKPQIS